MFIRLYQTFYYSRHWNRRICVNYETDTSLLLWCLRRLTSVANQCSPKLWKTLCEDAIEARVIILYKTFKLYKKTLIAGGLYINQSTVGSELLHPAILSITLSGNWALKRPFHFQITL